MPAPNPGLERYFIGKSKKIRSVDVKIFRSFDNYDAKAIP
jgi:hypothetical protein